jgi:hypothetical protein
MEPPSKRLRLDPSPYGVEEEEDQDELSMTPIQFETLQDPMYQLDKGRAKAATRLKSTFEDIFEKYGKDFDGVDDVINLYTDEIEVDNGHVQSLEKRKDGLTEDSLSSEEEGRITRGKPSRSKKRSESKSLIPGNPFKYNHTPQFRPSSDEFPGPRTYGPSSLTFPSSPFGANPPFDSRRTLSGDSLVDPVWQAPELPVLPLHYQHGSLTGLRQSQSSSFGPKRLVSAKAFLLHDISSSHASDADIEDDMLLGRSRQEVMSYPPSNSSGKSSLSTGCGASPCQSSQKIDQLSPLYGPDTMADELQLKSGEVEKASVQNESMEVSMAEVALATHPSKTPKSPCSPCSLRRKRGQRRKLGTAKSAMIPNQLPRKEDRPLRPNERRIEVIIPMLRRMFPMESNQTPAGKTPVAEDSSPGLCIENVSSAANNINATCEKDSPIALPSTGDREPIESQCSPASSADNEQDASEGHLAHIVECPTHASSPSICAESQKQRPTPTLKDTGLSGTDIPGCDEENPAIVWNEACAELRLAPSEVHGSTDQLVTECPHETHRKLDHCNESERMALSQLFSQIGIVDEGDGQVVCNESLKEDVQSMLLMDRHDSGEEEVSMPLSPSTKTAGESSLDSTTERPEPAYTGDVSSQTITPLGSGNSPVEDGTVPGDGVDLSSTGANSEEEIHPIRATSVFLDLTEAHHDPVLWDMVGCLYVSEAYDNRVCTPESDVGSPSLVLFPLHEATESAPYQGRDFSSPTLRALGIYENQEPEVSNQPSFTSMHAAQIESHRLEVELPDITQSLSLAGRGSPGREPPAFTCEEDVFYTPELVLRPSSRSTWMGAQPNIGMGRSLSPELGTPIGSEIVRNAASMVPATPPRRRGPRSSKRQSNHQRTPSSRRFPLTSLLPDGIDDESDDELSVADTASSRFFTPISRASPSLPPPHSASRKTTRESGLVVRSPIRTPPRNRIFGHLNYPPPATDSRAAAGRNKHRTRGRAVHSSPLARTVAERVLLGTPTRRSRLHHAAPTTPNSPSSSLVASPHGTLRRCGEAGFVCERDFCLTCCK